MRVGHLFHVLAEPSRRGRRKSMEDLSFEPALYLCLLQGLLLLCGKRRSKPWAGSFLTCGLAPSNMCSLVYKIYIIVQNIALDRVVCVCTSAQPHTAPAIAISPHARTTGLNLTRGHITVINMALVRQAASLRTS